MQISITKVITKINKYELIDYLLQEKVFSIVINGLNLLVVKYNDERHLIYFDDGSKKDLLIILPYISFYTLYEKVKKSKKESLTYKEINYKKENTQYKIRKYNYSHFLKMADWSHKSSVVKSNPAHLVTTKTGFSFYVGSGDEVVIFNRFNNDPDVYDIRGQDLIIKYGKDNEYHPDLVIYYNDGTICLYEVKPVILMGTNKVLKKYLAMKMFAKEHGYKVEMGGVSSYKSKIKTFSEIFDRKVNSKFQAYFERTINKNGVFTNNDLIKYKNKKRLVGKSETNPLYYDLVSIVSNDLDHYYMYTPKNHNNNVWKIILQKYKNRIVL